MPAYDSKRIYTVFFIFYLVVNLYMFMSVFLAVVYNTYKTHLKKVVKESVYHKRNLLSQAFDLMKEDERVDVDTFEQVMKNTMAEKTKDYFQTLWMILDQSGTAYLAISHDTNKTCDEKMVIRTLNSLPPPLVTLLLGML